MKQEIQACNGRSIHSRYKEIQMCCSSKPPNNNNCLQLFIFFTRYCQTLLDLFQTFYKGASPFLHSCQTPYLLLLLLLQQSKERKKLLNALMEALIPKGFPFRSENKFVQHLSFSVVATIQPILRKTKMSVSLDRVTLNETN